MKKTERILVKPSSVAKVEDLAKENWVWCDVCECLTYLYGCECGGSSCNAGGCDKCRHVWPLVTLAEKLGLAPDEETLKEECRLAGGTPETKLFNEIFGENTAI